VIKTDSASLQQSSEHLVILGSAFALSMNLLFACPGTAKANEILTQGGKVYLCVAVKGSKCFDCGGNPITIKEDGIVSDTNRICPTQSDGKDDSGQIQNPPENSRHKPADNSSRQPVDTTPGQGVQSPQ
jgi:hypothetical protein